MKISSIFCSIIIIMLFCGCAGMNQTLHVVTFNVRYDNPGDGGNQWELRVPVVASYFNEEMPDIVGMQEVLHSQVLDLLDIMAGYSYIGTGRDDGRQAGEYSPIFYRNDKFILLDSSQFWLSESPDVIGSVGWDAAITRIVTWAKFEHNESGKEFFVFNTHFDHMGNLAREMSPNVISQRISSIAGDSPVILTGDFNIRKNHTTLGSGLYDNLITTFRENNSLTHTLEISESPVTTAGATSTGFRENWQIGNEGDAIDYIFVTDHFSVDVYRVDRIIEDGVFISDHWPVVSVLKF